LPKSTGLGLYSPLKVSSTGMFILL
jgi:hypothetical protein